MGELTRVNVRIKGAYDANAVSAAGGVDCGEQSVVQQQFKDETDINTIVRRFGLEVSSTPVPSQGLYIDVTGIHDYASAAEAVARAEAAFMMFPAEVRARYGNDPGRLLEFVSRANVEELEALNVKPEPAVEPPPAWLPEMAKELAKAVRPPAPVPPKAE